MLALSNNSEKISVEIEKQIVKHGLEGVSSAYKISTFTSFLCSILTRKEVLLFMDVKVILTLYVVRQVGLVLMFLNRHDTCMSK